MYLIAEFNNKKYNLGYCIHKDMEDKLVYLYKSYFTNLSIRKIETIKFRSEFFPQDQFIKDYKAHHCLSQAIEHLPS